MRKLIMIAVVISFILLAGCTNQAQMDEMNEQVKQYENKIEELEIEISELKDELVPYDTLVINDMTTNEIKEHLEIIDAENVRLKLLNDSLVDYIHMLENPGSEGSISHPTVPIHQIK